MQQSKTNYSRVFLLLLKIGIAAFAVWFIYRRVIEKENTADWWWLVNEAIFSHLQLCILILCLMILNWSVEALKWKRMIAKIEQISFFKSLEAVFSGLTVSFFTPNRIGEYAGRVFHLQKADRIKATLITVIENCSQLLVTIVVGSIAAIFFIQHELDLPAYLHVGVTILLIGLAGGSLILFFGIQVLEVIFQRLPMPGSWKSYLSVFSMYKPGELFRVFLLAVLRYCIFSFQFFLLLKVFGLEIPYPEAMILITMVFFTMTVIPTISFMEIGVRGAVATYFFSHYSADPLPVINASFALWLVNLVIPALVGALFVFQFKFSRRSQ